jgi:phage terminase large subunit
MEINEVYMPYLWDESRFLVVYGGAMSGKSVFCAQKIVFRTVLEKGHRFLALRKVATTVKRSIFQELKDVIYENNMEKEFRINKSDYTITHFTGNEILCMGLDEPEKVKSIKGITGMWLEEATDFNPEDLNQLDIRIRGHKSNYVQYMLSFNPIDEHNWLKSRFFDNQDPKATTLKTTYKDNEFLTDDDAAQIESYKTKNELFYQVYCLGDWGVIDTSNKFLYNFDKELHVGECAYNPGKPLKISFDFNLEPFACILYQNTDSGGIVVFDKVRLDNSDIYQVCDKIKANYPDAFYIVTGDKSGYNRTGTVRGKTSYWKIIKTELSLRDPQIKLRPKNLDLVSSRVLCNSAMKWKSITIDPALSELINDCTYAQVDEKGELIKDRRKNKNDFLDCLRYALDIEWPDLLKIKK